MVVLASISLYHDSGPGLLSWLPANTSLIRLLVSKYRNGYESFEQNSGFEAVMARMPLNLTFVKALKFNYAGLFRTLFSHSTHEV